MLLACIQSYVQADEDDFAGLVLWKRGELLSESAVNVKMSTPPLVYISK